MGRNDWLLHYREYRQCPNHDHTTEHAYNFGKKVWWCTDCAYPFPAGRQLAALNNLPESTPQEVTTFTIAQAVKTASEKQPRLAGRLERAGDILRSAGAPYKAKPPADRLWTVQSQSRDKVAYLVDRDDRSCTCPDHRQYLATEGRRGAPSGWCKHRLAVELLLRVQRSNGDSTRQDPPAARRSGVTTRRHDSRWVPAPEAVADQIAAAQAGVPILVA